MSEYVGSYGRDGGTCANCGKHLCDHDADRRLGERTVFTCKIAKPPRRVVVVEVDADDLSPAQAAKVLRTAALQLEGPEPERSSWHGLPGARVYLEDVQDWRGVWRTELR